VFLPALVTLAVALSVPAAPGDGLGLLGGDPAPVTRPARPAEAPARLPTLPGAPVAPVAGIAAAVAAVTRRRRGGGSRPAPPGPAPGPGAAPVVIFVSGHGSDHLQTFADLQVQMNLPPERVRYFDYRFALSSEVDHVDASEEVPISDLAVALSAYVAGVTAAGVPVYLIGHSKGGAAIAEMLGRWDETPGNAIDGVTGAALLDPPIATGVLGTLQRIGAIIGPVPDNGGYDPITCDWLVLCRDRRSHLGEAAGVEVVVIRNPDAFLTSFHDRPDGLRVLDLDDGGAHALTRLWTRGSVVGRMTEAHTSVLHHPAVAACLAEELAAPGSCRWTGGGGAAPGWIGTGSGRAPNVLR
jgi:hypothetical protein